MTAGELLAAAERKAQDAELNLKSCADSLSAHARGGRGVPNQEVIALAHAQAVIASAYANIAWAKAGMTDG